ncbi:FecCD family ABC transporter permease [Rhizohabitans arisaemae]|uniref:FecCD family ABC transporter permease n=1 Tax=Rhizohabitans arisaemae TaxID=2720610 RepID=UPI0024B1CA58|nr:iron chelate uptake ABC transporter family permease subunit [Rhizohabitans arisaemae]
MKTIEAPTTVAALRRRAARREAGVVAVLAVTALALGVVGLTYGKASVTPAEVLAAITGRADAMTGFVILELRLPRLIAAVVAGACLAVSGALFQSVLRNPLVSPDIIGVTQSAATTGAVALLAFGLGGLALTGTVIGGTLLAAVLLYVLAWRDGSGYRLVLVGIGVAAVSAGLVSYVLTRSEVQDAQKVYAWISGSLARAEWETLVPLLLGAAPLFLITLPLARRLTVLQLGDDTAGALGVHVRRSRLGLLAVAVCLAAVAVGVVGPISFVALVSAPIARRVVGAGAPALSASALVGAVILLASDLVAQFAVPGLTLPAGVVTGVVGAPYLLWLILRSRSA